MAQLERELQRECGLSIPEYEVLVHLSEAEDRKLRMARLAGLVVASKSRLTHLVNRMEQRGTVGREECATDRRGSFAVLTDAGWDLLQTAAPVHLRGAREHMVDLIGTEKLVALGSSCAIFEAHLEPHQR